MKELESPIMKKYDVLTIRMTAFIFGLYAAGVFFSLILFLFAKDGSHISLSLFPLLNVLFFGCIFFFSLDRIIKTMLARLEEHEALIKELKNKLENNKNT